MFITHAEKIGSERFHGYNIWKDAGRTGVEIEDGLQRACERRDQLDDPLRMLLFKIEDKRRLGVVLSREKNIFCSDFRDVSPLGGIGTKRSV